MSSYDDFDWPDKFDRADTTPLYWYNRASDLRAAAAAVCFAIDDDEVGASVVARYELGEGFSMTAAAPPVYELLCGLSIELLLKAIAVARSQPVPQHHRLRDLAAYVGAEMTAAESGVLDVLTAAIRWSGRYPRPKSREEWETTLSDREPHLSEALELGNLTVSRYNGALDWPRISELWGKLHILYWKFHFPA